MVIPDELAELRRQVDAGKIHPCFGMHPDEVEAIERCYGVSYGESSMIDPGDIDVDEPLGMLGNPYITAPEIQVMQERLYQRIAESFGIGPLAINPSLSVGAESFGVPPAPIDINHCSLEEWAARVDGLVREVRDAG
jgi:hypothetical protein